MSYPILPRAPHGGPQSADENILDFSVNTNPLGPNPALMEIWQRADLCRYPDPRYRQTRHALATHHCYPPEGVTLGVGASELLHRIVRAFVEPGDLVISLGAPFGEFERAVALQRGCLQIIERRWQAVSAGAKLIYLSNPHNPTGHYLETADLPHSPLIVIDEAYLPFLPDALELPLCPNLIRLRSPGKAHGLLGMRMAYALAHPDITVHLDNLQPAWAFPSPLADVLAALPEQEQFLKDTLPAARRWASGLAQELGATPTSLHFFTVWVTDARRVTADLLARGLRVRDCASFGHPNLIRIATRAPDENRILVRAWRELNGP